MAFFFPLISRKALPLQRREEECLFYRDVAQLVSVRVWGACGRRFESGHPDKRRKRIIFFHCLLLVKTRGIFLLRSFAGNNFLPLQFLFCKRNLQVLKMQVMQAKSAFYA